MILEGNWKDPPWVFGREGFGGHVRNCGPKCNGTRGARNSVCLNDHKPEMTRVTVRAWVFTTVCCKRDAQQRTFGRKESV
jgi:hypothetical protein